MTSIIKNNKEHLETLESVIQKNIGAFYEVGRALMEIRDKGLYRDVLGHDTFEDYCKERWDFSRFYAYRLIDSVKVIKNVDNCQQKPVTESQTRPLVRLEPAQQREAWQKAVETAPEGKVTAAHVNRVVKEMTSEQTTIKKELKPTIPEYAFYFAKTAISHLERISKDDPTREKALAMVENWIKQNRKGNK